MKNQKHSALAALLALVMLAGCAKSSEQLASTRLKAEATVTSLALPDIPVADTQRCPDPGVREGKPALVELARNRVARGECSRRHQRVVKFYRDIQKGHEGKVK